MSNTEFGFISSVARLFADIPRGGFDAIGDDCTCIGIGGGESLVISTDMLVENVHFLRDASSPYELGCKSLLVNLSDVAAMGARPAASLLSLSLPRDATGVWAEGAWLGGRAEVHAMMDISDGIASDLRHIMECSGVGAEVHTECIPTDVDVETAVCGGEDYELLLTVDAGCCDKLREDYNALLMPIYAADDLYRFEHRLRAQQQRQ